MRTFKHSGRLGDIIYSLPTMRALGGGELLLAPSETYDFSEREIALIAPLIEGQPYVSSVKTWNGEDVDYDLDRFRLQPGIHTTNLAMLHLEAFGLPESEVRVPWLNIDPITHCRPVFARSDRHQGFAAMWPLARDLFPEAIFVGSENEHRDFEREFGSIERRETADLSELARVIAGGSVFVGNQSCPNAIAQALKKRSILEVATFHPNCRFNRPWCVEVTDESDLPTVKYWSKEWSLFPKPIVDDHTVTQLGPAKGRGVSIVIVTYNSASTIEECLSACLRESTPVDQIIVIDNDSADLTYELASNRFAGTAHTVVRNKSNVGYSKAANQGMRLAKAEFILLLNPDAFLSQGSVAKMTSRFGDPYVAAVGPVCNHVAGDQFARLHFPKSEEPAGFHELADLLDAHVGGRTQTTPLLIGFCLMLRRSVLDEIGLLDEDLALGGDDLELCWRLRSHEYRAVIARDAFVEHRAGTSFSSLPSEEADSWLGQSNMALHRKLASYYVPGPVPSSQDLWGIGILAPPRRESV